MITVRTQLSLNDYYNAMVTQTYRKPMVMFAIIFCLLVLAASAVLKVVFHVYTTVASPLFYVFVIYLFFGQPVLLWYMSKRAYQRNPAAHQPMTYTFTDDGIGVDTGAQHESLRWMSILKIVETRAVVLIYRTERAAYMLRSADFGDQLADFRHLVRSHGVKSRLRKS